ncbi:MAG TPA: NAD-dependent epimerase/dehydratase family protein [Candidatus Fermentibacter daniensis]|jgi:nucleoside-diphosphate-sugar epimerase|nr:MAG: hypothetical protein AO395_00585 [Candidatus Fermentibacter daniensis]MBP7719614.1 NAD-dependent epimerase/dehydratase family protein [Candidatus Fermentibacter sp.]OQC69810.1 MAG: NAD dependent epimerase/dehydratase family protein [candidate division Hyd24-12 bacterium ADurb.Bin004]KZD18644.1 MAG: hypothetical protein AO396_01970 [Candidatus Fermentibacter daniensis]NLI03020.1 NAD-dependent epimerase/dehydratase family protein [Candidatus Fermentibacter daniensis]
MSDVLITGATGFLGSHLVGAAAGAGCGPRAVCRHSSDTSRVRGCSRIDRIDMLDPGAYRCAMEGVSTVFHLAGATSARSREAFDRSNAAVTSAVLEARRLFAPEARFVFVSSQSAGGPSGSRPITPYGRSKLLAECIVRRSSNWVIVRPPAVFGPGDDAMAPMFRAAAKGVFLSPAGRGGVPLIYAKDLADYLVRLADAPDAEGRTLEPSYGKVFGWSEIRDLLQTASGRRVVRIPVIPPLVVAAGWICGTAGRLTGRSPVFDFHKGREMVAKGWTACDPSRAGVPGWTPATPPEKAFSETMAWTGQRL